ncbi:YqkE family protein [Bacillus sp. RG28]|uniref:YqkE family protein n=1 Tax=Gottfriedia endophytica TaxID=2820819 RepID=A0A940NMT4_9BACI|nr:YqkE family protein [Gottfriedia endophytica]MBP0724313.1 YqkE family protein [Gottfriedia endophytica]
MKKRKVQPKSPSFEEKEKISLGSLMNEEVLNKLKNTKKALQEKEVKQKEAEEAKIREEKRLREKNKSFEELLNESNMTWKDFK